jgi:hypothetical protein
LGLPGKYLEKSWPGSHDPLRHDSLLKKNIAIHIIIPFDAWFPNKLSLNYYFISINYSSSSRDRLLAKPKNNSTV